MRRSHFPLQWEEQRESAWQLNSGQDVAARTQELLRLLSPGNGFFPRIV